MDELENTPQSKSKKIIITITSIVVIILLATITAILVSKLCFTTYIVEGVSMEPTLDGGIYGEKLDGERLILNKVATIKRNDIIVFTPTSWFGENSTRSLVKRVIAVGGDKIKIENNKVYLNNTILNEPYIKEDSIMENLAEIIIPEGEFFCMGDNRTRSDDSRAHGCVKQDEVVGRCWLIKDKNNKLRRP